MKLFVILLVFGFSFTDVTVKGQTVNLENVRDNYVKAVSDKNLCMTMIQELSKETGSPLFLAYLGAFKIIWAKHVINPFVKFSTFNSGKKHIEAAVKEEDSNVEIRFIRLSIQKNCPAFLGYNTNIDQDKNFIHANMNNISSAQLKKMVAELV